MGQIVRNFPGSLRGERKLELARESYFLGLRTLSAVVAIVRGNVAELREWIGQHVRNERHLTDEARIASVTDRVLFLMSFWMAFGVVRRVSYAVGSVHLK